MNRRPLPWPVCLLLLALLAAPRHAQADARAAQVNTLFAEWDRPDSPGCSVAIYQDEEIVFERGYGMADLEHGIANRPSTVFHVASVSKQFTAAAIILLAQEGKLSLDDPVRKYVPELPDFGAAITIRHLLHHVSGLRDQWDLLRLSGWRFFEDRVTDADVMNLVRRQKQLNFLPGEKHSYSNTGYTLLAQIVSRVSGKSFREFTSERIFTPLGMGSTRFRDDFSDVVPGIAYGYTRRGDAFKVSVPNFDTVGATSLLTTVRDLAAWDRNFHEGKVGGEELQRQMLRAGALNDGRQIGYASGLNLGSYRGAAIVGHSGVDAGYRAYVVRFPEYRFGIACLCNVRDATPRSLAEQIADIYLADRLQAPAHGVKTSAVPTRLDGLTGTYLNVDGRDVQKIFLRDGELWMTRSREANGRRLEPLGDGRFRVTDRLDRAEFTGRNPMRLTFTPEVGEAQIFERAQHYTIATHELAQFAGTYRSDEIELPYTISVKGGALVITSMKLVDGLPLTPLATDLFDASDLGAVRFARNERGLVSGFAVNTERSVDVRFFRSSTGASPLAPE